jgi:hypothetical protein
MRVDEMTFIKYVLATSDALVSVIRKLFNAVASIGDCDSKGNDNGVLTNVAEALAAVVAAGADASKHCVLIFWFRSVCSPMRFAK